MQLSVTKVLWKLAGEYMHNVITFREAKSKEK